MINVLIGIFYIALVALISYLLYYIIKIAIKDAYYELEFRQEEDQTTYENANLNNDEEKL